MTADSTHDGPTSEDPTGEDPGAEDDALARLGGRRQAFVRHLLITGNGSEAARRAGYSARSAARTASRLLRTPAVAAALDAQRRRTARRLAISAERVLTEYARIAFSDLTDYLAWGPDGLTLAPSARLDADRAAAVAEVAETGAGRVRIKLHDKVRALDALAKRLGLAGEPGGADSRHEAWLARIAALAAARAAGDKSTGAD